MEEVERAQERLENIRGVKPILSALRTISLGSWQAALKHRSGVRDYAGRLVAILPSLVPHLRVQQGLTDRLRERLSLVVPAVGRRVVRHKTASQTRCIECVVIGSERGLCGRFNISAADHAERYLRRESARGLKINLTVLGSRAERALRRRGFDPALVGGISPTRVPTLALALELSRRWLTAYEKRQLDAVDVIHNAYRGTGIYRPTTTRLIPPELPRRGTVPSPEVGRNQPSKDTRSAEARAESWPPPIVETDPLSLYTTVVEQWAAARLLELLSDSSAAEHSTRFQLMESATQNADRLIEELTLIVQTERRKEITQEMAELATGAGLVGRD